MAKRFPDQILCEFSSPATFNDVTGGRQVFGNPDLERAQIDNFDLRWEWYPQAGESLSVGGFYKNFINRSSRLLWFVCTAFCDVPKCRLCTELRYGGGFSRKNFGFLGGQGWRTLVIGGECFLDLFVVELSRQCGYPNVEMPVHSKGQSPYVYNLQFGYDNPEGKGGVTALYNVFGPRDTEARSVWVRLITIEEPITSFGFGESYFKSRATFGLGFKCQNLIGPGSSRVRTGGWMIGEEVCMMVERLDSLLIGYRH